MKPDRIECLAPSASGGRSRGVANLSELAVLTPSASVLVQILSPSSTLGVWRASGVLSREAAYLRVLAANFAGLIVVVPENSVADTDLGPGARVVHGTGDLLVEATLNALRTPEFSGRECVLRSQEFDTADLLLAVHARLIADRRSVTVAARGTFPWSRVVVRMHGPDSTQAHKVGASEGRLARLADTVVGSSETMVVDLAWRYQLDPMRTAVVPRFVSPDMPIRGSEDRDRGRVVCMAPLTAGAQTQLLVEAAAMLPDGVRERVSLTIIGSGPEREKLQAIAKSTGLDLTIESDLSYEQTIERLAKAAIYCQPAAIDGPPPALLDAMASGAAVIVSDTANVGRLIEHGFTGLRVPPEPSAMARAIEGLLDDPAWRDALGTAAGNSVRDTLALPRLAGIEASIIAQAMRQRGARQAA
jgi:Glycosyl transferases group 1